MPGKSRPTTIDSTACCVPAGKAYFQITSPPGFSPRAVNCPLVCCGSGTNMTPHQFSWPLPVRSACIKPRKMPPPGILAASRNWPLASSMASELPSLTQNKFAVPLGIGRAGQDAADVEQVAAGPDQRALQGNAFHAHRAGKADVALQHAVAVQIAQLDVADARMAILQGIGRIAQHVVELLVEQMEPLLGGSKGREVPLAVAARGRAQIDEELFLGDLRLVVGDQLAVRGRVRSPSGSRR